MEVREFGVQIKKERRLNMNSFTQTFADMQEKLGYTNKYIAENLGVQEEVISMIKNGKRLPTPEQFINLDKHMGFSQVGIADSLVDDIVDELEYLTIYEKIKVLFYIKGLVK